MEIQDQSSFERFYRICTDIPFRSPTGLSVLLQKAAYQCSGRSCCIAVTHKLNEDLRQAADNILSLNTELSIIQIGGEQQGNNLRHNPDKRVRIFKISKEQEIAEVLDVQQGGRVL